MPKGVYEHKGHSFSVEARKKMSLSATGKKKTPESIRKLSKSLTGRKLTEEHKRNIGLNGFHLGMLGKTVSDETKKKISIANSGEKSYLWKDGRSKNKEWVSWRKNKRNRVIKRLKTESLSHTYGEWELLKKQYNYACPCCKKSEPEINLTEDHIIPLSKGGLDLIENIQPLCLSCNVKKHTLIIKY